MSAPSGFETPGFEVPELEVCGGDADLALAAVAHPGAAVRFAPDSTSDLARCFGMSGGQGTAELAVDLLRLDTDDGLVAAAVNMVVVGPPPDRLGRRHRRAPCRVEGDGRLLWEGTATTVVLANGEFLRGADVVPRGHPGDGRFEVHVYALDPGQRALMRRRLAGGGHVPHPGIVTASVTRAEVRFGRRVPFEVDGRRRSRTAGVEARIEPGALRVRF